MSATCSTRPAICWRFADQPDNPLEGIVACGRPESEDFKSYLDKITGHPKLKGIRRVLHTQPNDVGLGVTFIRNLAVLSSCGLSFDICVLARQLPIAIKFSFQMPGCGFHPGPLWSAPGQGREARSLARSPRGDGRVSECL